jgi:aspartate-semialdehyde dehydrogenase
MPRVGIIGAPPELAAELVSLLVERGFELAELRLLGEPDAAGEVVEVGPARLRLEAATPEHLEGLSTVLFFGDGTLASQLIDQALRSGALVIDATPFARRLGRAPLVVPEVNAGVAAALLGKGGLLASPMPASVGVAIALAPLHASVGVRRANVTAFESASQRGAEGPEELSRQTIGLVQGQGHDREEFPEQLAFNLRPQVAADASGWAVEERAIASEVAGLLGEPKIAIVATVVRAPVFFGAAAAIHVELARPVTAEEIREQLRTAPGIFLAGSLPARHKDEDDEDYDPETDERPGPVEVTGSDAIHVARVRVDPEDPSQAALWIAFDDVRKGTAQNVIGILEIALRGRG